MDNLFSNKEKPIQSTEPLSVSQLSRQINTALEARIGRVEVIGQVNSPKLTQHWYFTLADDDAKIDCAMWATKLSGVEPKGWKPSQGDLVHITGTIGHYAKFGKTQLYVEKMRPAGDEKGKLQQQFDAFVKELREKGWFDIEYKKALPQFPRKIAVITSKTSAAVKDVIETSRQRWGAVELFIVNVPVQGAVAAERIATALQRVDEVAESNNIDAIIVTRGGGSLEELWSFNERNVVEAAFYCNTPIVAAIGHESDVSIIELVSDHRASTPTQAAMVLVPDSGELLGMVQHQSQRLEHLLTSMLERLQSWTSQCARTISMSYLAFLHGKQSILSKCTEALIAQKPNAIFQQRQKRVLECDAGLQLAMKTRLQRKANQIASFSSTIEAINPLSVLHRGFSLTQDEGGQIVRTIKNVQEGQQIKTMLADGTIDSKVECTHE